VNKKILLIYLGSFLLILNHISFGQNDTVKTQKDTFFIKAGEYAYINDKLTFFINDTILFPSENLQIKRTNEKFEKSQNFYENLENKASNKRVTNELYNLLVKDYDKNKPKEDVISTEYFEKFQGKQIHSIQINSLDVFGPSINDTSRNASTGLSEKANNLHIKTLPIIIKNNLLIKTGDNVDPFELSDNERIIRKLPYIKDAKFILYENETDTNKVDLIIITQDVWSIGIEGNLTGTNSGYIEFFDKNIFGTGHQFGNVLDYNPDTQPIYGYEGYYDISNINGTFINSNFFYKHNDNRERYGLNVERKFISPDIKYGGGVSMIKELWYENYITDTNLKVTPQNHILEDIWLGRSIKLSENIRTSFRQNLFITTRLINDAYRFKETNVIDSTLKYLDNTMILMNVGISSTKFYKGRLISSFGKTEDIPVGSKFGMKAGFHSDEIGTRLCLGFDFSIATYNPKIGYLFTGIEAGSFTHAKQFEQSLVKFRLEYFTKLLNIFSFQSRQFVKIEYLVGYNRRPYEKLTINNNEGIRLFRMDNLYGDEKLVVSFENVLFTPINFYGFRFAVFGFADFGIIGNKTASVLKNDIYSGVGAGVRIRNDNLVFKTLEIKLIYFPIVPDNHNSTFIHFANERGFSFQNFEITPPDVATYK